MAAYVISEVRIKDEEAAGQYRMLAAASIEKYGGRYLASAAGAHVMEGKGAPGRMVIVEFPSMQRIHEWYSSPEYADALAFRRKALRRRLMFVEGLVS